MKKIILLGIIMLSLTGCTNDFKYTHAIIDIGGKPIEVAIDYWNTSSYEYKDIIIRDVEGNVYFTSLENCVLFSKND